MYAHIYKCNDTYTLIHIYIYAWAACTCMHTFTHVMISIHLYKHTLAACTEAALSCAISYYIQIHTHIHVYIYVHIYLYLYVWAAPLIHRLAAWTRRWAVMLDNIKIYTHTYTSLHICSCVYVRMICSTDLLAACAGAVLSSAAS